MVSPAAKIVVSVGRMEELERKPVCKQDATPVFRCSVTSSHAEYTLLFLCDSVSFGLECGSLGCSFRDFVSDTGG